MKKLLSTLRIATALVLSVFSSNILPQTAQAYSLSNPDGDYKKVYVCKYVGTPGVDERLQTGDNPISVSTSALKDFTGLGSFFNDAQGRSVAIAWDNGDKVEPPVSMCPAPEGPLSLPSAPEPVAPTCDAAGSLTLPADTTDIHWSISPAYSGPGTYDVTATAQGGKEFVGGQTSVTFEGIEVLPQLTGDQCETPPTPEAPSVDIEVEPCTVNTNSTDAVKVTVTNTADATDNAVVYTATVKNASTDATVTSFTFASLADGASASHTFNGLSEGDYYVVITGNDQTTVTSEDFSVNKCEKETPPPCQANCGGEEDKKVFVCKYVGTPGISERLQTGQNPISVSVNSIKDFHGIGSYFNDAQGRSYVLAYDNGQPEPSASECPGNEKPSTQVPVPVCVEKDHTTSVTIRVFNHNDYAVTYKVVVEQPDGTGTNELVASIPANGSHDFTFNGYGVGTFDYTVYEGTQVESSSTLLRPLTQVPQTEFTWKQVFTHNFTIALCQPEQPPVVDVCLNLPGNQTSVPEGYVKDGDNCARVLGTTDVCPNIEGTQTSVPVGMVKDTNGNCVSPVTPPVGGAGAGQVLGEALPAELPATGGTNLPNPLLSIVAGFLTYLFLKSRNTRKAEA